jgi:hypothetical protein
VYVVLAITAGFAIRSLAQDRRRIVGLGALGLCLAACFPALAVMRPWEYHNILGGGTGQAYRYFRNDGVDLSQRDKEIARYYHRNLEPRGEVPYLIYYTPKADLDYRGVNAKSLLDPDENDLPPATISGTLIVASTTVAPAIWSDFPALRNATPVDRMGNVLVYRGKYYLPGVRADALFSRVDKLLAEQQPDLTEVESLLREGLSLRTNDFPGWMRLGNILLLRGERVQSIAAYQKARDSVPPSPVRQMFEDQIRLMSTKPLESITPMRNPSTE